jgi:sugar/nucleoside kinase (ribokinase family)
VPELLLTKASAGAVVIAGGVREHVHTRRIEIADPTGAGDAFLAAYSWARASGHRPISAARQAATTAARVLELELERQQLA